MLNRSRFGLDPRAARITWTILVFLAALGLGYAVRRGVQDLAQKLPETSRRIQNGEIVVGLLARGGWESRQIREIDRLVQSHMGEIVGYAQQATTSVLKWLAGAWVIVLIPVLAFFILKDVERFTSTAIWRLGHEGRRRVWWGIAEDLHLLLGQYVRALLLLALITFVVWSAAFLAAGVPYALVLAGIGGALEVIPVIGPLTAGVVAIGVCLFAGYEHPRLLAVFILVWRAIQDYAINPLVMARGAVGARLVQFVHGRRVGPSPAGDRRHCRGVPVHWGPPVHLTAPRSDAHLDRHSNGGLAMRPLRGFGILVLTIGLASAWGCGSTATKEGTGEYVDDSVITTKVKAAIFNDATLKVNEINVETFKGVVQLSGFVRSQADIDQAVRVARGVAGVKSVKNDMRIK